MRIYAETWYMSGSWDCLMPRCYELKVADDATSDEIELCITEFKDKIFAYLKNVDEYVKRVGIKYDVFKDFDLQPYRFKFEYVTEAEYEDERVNHTKFKAWLDSHDKE